MLPRTGSLPFVKEREPMLRNKTFMLVCLPLLVCIVATIGVSSHYSRLLDGQRPNKERLLETATGGKPHYDPIQYRAKDSRPAIMKPQFVDANDAKIAAGIKGIGVSIGGDSRFYPLYILQYHQILNDTCGNTPVVCSY